MTAHTQPIKCGHCNENSVMKLIGDIRHVTDEWESGDDVYPSLTEFGYRYNLLECPKCKGITIAQYEWASTVEDEEEFWESLRYDKFLYPPNSLYSIDVLQKDPAPWFIDPTRIKELSNIKSSRFDLRRLIQLCNEINNCYANSNYFAVILLSRSLLDHVPPIFGYKTFKEVANNYSNGKSFKESIEYLEMSLRKIADASLHLPIREKEILPNKTQINFHSGLDVLLSEVVRILNQPIRK